MALQAESHPQRELIDKWLLAGETLRAVAKKANPPISVMALHRYKTFRLDIARRAAGALAAMQTPQVQQAMANTANHDQAVQVLTRAALAADPYLARIGKHQQMTDQVLQDAARAKDGRTVSSLIATDYKGLELAAKLTGRLETAGSTTVQIVVSTEAARELQRQAEPAIDVDFEDVGLK